MAGITTNIFPIFNLNELSSKYRLYVIRGLTREHSEYYQNRQNIQKRLSYQLQKPITTIERNDTTYLVVRDDLEGDPPSPFPMVRANPVVFERVEEVFELDYTMRSVENDALCLRFLQFELQGELRHDKRFWQAGAGQPFFLKAPDEVHGGRATYAGFDMRPIITHDGGIGLCIDTTFKTLSEIPLPAILSRDDFKRWKGKRCIYHFGNDDWYEIQIRALSDFTCDQHPVPLPDGKTGTLLSVLQTKFKRPYPPEFANMPHDASVILYWNNKEEERSAPTPLCYPVYGTDDLQTGRRHRNAILNPDDRLSDAITLATKYLNNLHFGGIKLTIASASFQAPRRMFQVPDLKFGNETVLSVRGTEKAEQIALDQLGKMRKALLEQEKVGFYVRSPFTRQYLILPQSVYDTWGLQFIEDLKKTVNRLYPQNTEYALTIETYDDSGVKTYANQGQAIRRTLEEKPWQPGYAVIMLHHTQDRRIREEDQLEALAIHLFRDQDITAAVIHSEVGNASYKFIQGKDGKPRYVQINIGTITGYLYGVALNQVLLTNWKWPFILDTDLHADVTIGIDVKNSMAGLVIVGKHGHDVRWILEKTKRGERLLKNEMKQNLIAILTVCLQNIWDKRRTKLRDTFG